MGSARRRTSTRSSAGPAARACARVDGSSVTAGIEDLLVLKTTGSGWEGYLHEQYTSLPETDDRILCTVVTASWDYGADADYDAAWEAARDAILRTFGDHYSPSVQYTLLRLGEAVLEAVPEIERVRFSLPNRHHLLFDLSRFGLENDHEIFHATTEPYGLIEGTVERSAVSRRIRTGSLPPPLRLGCMAATVASTSVTDLALAAKAAARKLATVDSATKDRALHAIADALEARMSEILEANGRDLEAGRESGLSAALMDRLALDEGRVRGIADGARAIAALPDPVGEVVGGGRLANGLEVRKVRVPLGVIAVVYEARPNVTIDAAALCLKSGNAVLLRGSSSAAHSNAVLARIAREAAARQASRTAAWRSSPAAAARSWPSWPPRRASST